MFQDITETDLNSIEDYVKTNLFDILKIDKCGVENAAWFFGPFSSRPDQFFFLPDGKELIILSIARVKKTVKTEGYAYFANYAVPEQNTPEYGNLVHTVFGPVFENKQEHIIPEFGESSYLTDATDEDQFLGPGFSIKKMESTSVTHRLLAKLKAVADQNLTRNKTGYRFPTDVKDLAVFIRLYGGKMLYQTLHKNLELAFPSLDTTNRIIRKLDNPSIEGCLRANELLKYLNDRELPLVVTISEDATSIEGRVQYDPRTNQVCGFILPLDEETGMPIQGAFPARSGMEIISHFNENHTVARNVNVVMAKPLANFPAVPLLIFSTDSKFKSHHVQKRWKFIVNELEKLKIKVLAISTDSDSRYNSAMKRNAMLGNGKRLNIMEADWFCSGLDANFEGPFNFQDHLHILTKLRNLFLKTTFNQGKLPIGQKFYVQKGHLQFLLDNFRKDEHQLTTSILDPVDRQNVGSALRMCDQKVIALLKKNLPRSEGTVTFLEIMRSVYDTFYDSYLTPLQRVGTIWRSVFILRIWRDYVAKQEFLTLKDNFVTSYTYACIEINAHSLVQIIIYLKNNNLDEWFMPFLFDSQACESFFREVRSLTTVFHRAANCSVKEIIARINKILLLNEITNRSSFEFPRAKKSKAFTDKRSHQLPTKEEIYEEIENSRYAAIKYCEEIYLIDEDDGLPDMDCKIPSLKTTSKEKPRAHNKIQIQHSELVHKLSQLKAVTLKNYANCVKEDIPETSPYVEVYNDGKKRIVVKKSSLVWLLRADLGKLSSDRIQRVQGTLLHRAKNKKKKVTKPVKRLNRNRVQIYRRSKT